MSDQPGLNSLAFDGLAHVFEASPVGMITLRAEQGDGVRPALNGVGLGLPDVRRIERFPGGQVGWMSPDELLLLCPRDGVGDLLAALSTRLSGSHHLLADVSDARTLFRVEGVGAAEVLAKLSPVDLLDGQFPIRELRRTRLAQVATAFWRDESGFSVICFRSVATYAFDVMTHAARRGSGLD